MIDFSDVEDAFLYVSSDQPFMNSAVLNRKTGATYYQSDLSGIDEFPEDVDSDDYVTIPHKNVLDLGRDLVFDFVSHHLPNEFETVQQFFRSRGAFSRYKSLLDSTGLLDDWHRFEDEKTKSALREWCKDNNLELRESG